MSETKRLKVKGPRCSVKGCNYPATERVRYEDEDGPMTFTLCRDHLKEFLRFKGEPYRGGERMGTKELMEMGDEAMTQRVMMAAKSFGFVIDEHGIARAPNSEEIKLLVRYCLTYGFDPLLNEVCLYQGRPYPLIDGLRRKAQETGKYRGLKMEAIKDKELKKALGFSEEDIVFKATVKKEENGQICEYERYGGVARWEIEEMSKRDPSRHRYPVLHQRPADMAQNRAERDALRAAFQFRFPGIEGIPLEGGYREIEEPPRKEPPEHRAFQIKKDEQPKMF